MKDVAHLSGKSAKDVANLVLWLSSPGGFESTLSYIALPVISLDAASELSPKSGQHAANQGQKRDQKGEDVQLGRSSLITVFETLFGVGVRHVLQLHVDDMEAPSHSDAAIEKCLVGEDSMSSNAVGKGNRRIHVELWYVIAVCTISISNLGLMAGRGVTLAVLEGNADLCLKELEKAGHER